MKVKLCTALIFYFMVVPIRSQFDFLSPKLRLYQSLISNFAKLKILGIIKPSINGTACAKDLTTLMNAAFKAEWWAAKMIDASSKLNSGILQGNIKLLGDYDQCLALQKNQAGVGLDTKYCTVLVKFNRKLDNFIYRNMIDEDRTDQDSNKRTFSTDLFNVYSQLDLGLCVPKSCTFRDLTRLWKQIQQSYETPFIVKFSDKLCYYKDKEVPSNVLDFYVFWFFGMVLFVEVACTAYDVIAQPDRKKPNLFVNFSLYTNGRRLLSKHCENETLKCLYGIRTFSIIWVVLGHVMLIRILNAKNAMDVVSEWTGRLENGWLLSSVYSVDTFLAVSGLLVVYVYLEYTRIYRLNFLLFYGHRVLRLGPALFATILVEVSVVKYFVDGPLAYPYLSTMMTSCEKTGVNTLFFASNTVPRDDRCLWHSWYISVDSQLYLLAPLIVYWLKKSPSKAFIGIFALCIASFGHTWISVIENNAGYISFVDKNSGLTYFSTIHRMPAWLIGTCLGYLLYRHNFQKITIPKKVNLLLWALSIAIIVTLSLYQPILFREEHRLYRSAFFNTFSRPLWALAVCFIMFSCCTGHSERVNAFLSHRVFIVIGKMTYSIYLIHLTIIHIFMANKRQSMYFSTSELLIEFWGYLVYVLISGALLCLVFETPTVSILRYLEAYTANMIKKRLKK